MAKKKSKKKDSIVTLILRYKFFVAILLIFTFANNVTSLIIPKLSAIAIDNYTDGTFDASFFTAVFFGIATAILAFALIQTYLSMFVSEKVAKDLRTDLMDKVSNQSYSFINKITPQRLLTNVTSDVGIIKMFISQGIVMTFTAFVLLIGSAVMLLTINLQLALLVLAFLPVIVLVFFFIFAKIQKFFEISQKNLDKLNLVISETIVGAPLIRVLNARKTEDGKFHEINDYTKSIGVKILTLFAALIPVVTFISSLIIVVILWQGGLQVINGTLSYGDLVAFYSYVGILVTPIFILGFTSGTLFRAFPSYDRIKEVINSEVEENTGTITKNITGDIEIKNVNLTIDEKEILKNINMKVGAKTRNAVIGPTGSGKTQIFNLVTGLLNPTEGEILLDGESIKNYNNDALFKQIGLVFQDSIIFNTTILDNLTFGEKFSEEQINKAIKTAALEEFIKGLPEGLNTQINERGANLSGGQKQRLTLARALILNPKILLLDDFTARVDRKTENEILSSLEENYKDTTLIMVSQKIEPVKNFDRIFLLMEGEILAQGTHEELMKNSIEYKLIFDSQKTTE